MVRVWNSQTAETVLKLVELRLADFKMNFDHITAMVTDGASIMVKLGQLAPCEHVICLSHTLHLVITDVFYPKKSDSAEDEAHVPPTSVEAERVFSAGGLFLTKLRSNMSDSILNKLIFLKLCLLL